MVKHKLSASALNCFLDSPRKYYWTYIARLVPLMSSVSTYDHDKICGILWAEFVDRFYHKVDEAKNLKLTLDAWNEQTEGWVPDKLKDKLTKALESWSATYYQQFSPDDGIRNGSELKLENDTFIGYLDGLSHNKVIHEVKSTSRSPSLAGQLWKVQNSTQVKLYAVMAEATGVIIEFAFKDPPYAIYRAPVLDITPEQRAEWKQGLDKLAEYIYSLGDDIANYPCHPDGCCMVSKGMTNMCQYETLCSMGLTDDTQIAYKEKSHRN